MNVKTLTRLLCICATISCGNSNLFCEAQTDSMNVIRQENGEFLGGIKYIGKNVDTELSNIVMTPEILDFLERRGFITKSQRKELKEG